MGILDDAIREHLDLKRRHGARDAELREIEEDAFGSGERPDPFAPGELFGETAPPAETEGGSGEASGPATPPPFEMPAAGEIGSEEPTRLVEPEAAAPAAPPEPAAPSLGEAEPLPADSSTKEVAAETGRPAAPAEPPSEDVPRAEALDDLFSAEEEPAPEAEPAPQAPESAPASRAPEPEESESLADLMAEEDETRAGGAVEVPPPPPPGAEAERSAEPEPEPSGAPLEPAGSSVPEPPPPPPEPGTEPPGRARGRVHHPTEEHPAPEPGSLDFPAVEPQADLDATVEPESGEAELRPAAPPDRGTGGGIFDFETDEGELPPAAGESDDFEELGPPSEEAPYGREEEEDLTGEHEQEAEDEDLLASSPEFAEEEDSAEEDLWFEKGPPQDFDFEDER